MSRATSLRPEEGGKIGKHGVVGPDPKTHPALAELRGDGELRRLGQKRDEEMMAEVARKKGLTLLTSPDGTEWTPSLPISSVTANALAGKPTTAHDMIMAWAKDAGIENTSRPYNVLLAEIVGAHSNDPHALANKLGMEALVTRAKYFGVVDADALTWEGLLDAYEKVIAKQVIARSVNAPVHPQCKSMPTLSIDGISTMPTHEKNADAALVARARALGIPDAATMSAPMLITAIEAAAVKAANEGAGGSMSAANATMAAKAIKVREEIEATIKKARAADKKTVSLGWLVRMRDFLRG